MPEVHWIIGARLRNQCLQHQERLIRVSPLAFFSLQHMQLHAERAGMVKPLTCIQRLLRPSARSLRPSIAFALVVGASLSLMASGAAPGHRGMAHRRAQSARLRRLATRHRVTRRVAAARSDPSVRPQGTPRHRFGTSMQPTAATERRCWRDPVLRLPPRATDCFGTVDLHVRQSTPDPGRGTSLRWDTDGCTHAHRLVHPAALVRRCCTAHASRDDAAHRHTSTHTHGCSRGAIRA